MKRIFAFVLLLGLLILSGCDKLKTLTGDAAQSASGEYAKGYNKIIDDIGDDIIDNYYDAIPESGPAKMSRNLLFPHHTFAARSLDEAKEAFASAKAGAPSAEAHLAGLADELLQASQDVTATYGDAQKYYAAENYKDDKGAGAKQLHSQMVSQTERYHEAVEKMGAALDKIEDEQMEAELKNYEADKNYSYWFRKMLSETKKVLTAVETSESAAQLETIMSNADSVNAEFAAFIKAKGGKSALPKVFQSFVAQTDNFFVVATRLRRENKAAQPNKTAIANDEKAIVSAYNVVVELANALYEVEPYGQLK
jgi:oligoendopeptidase F